MPTLSGHYSRVATTLPLLLLALHPTRAPAQQASIALAQEVFQKVKREFHIETGQIAIGEIRSLHVPGAVLQLRTDSIAFAADSSTQSDAAAAVATFVRKAIPDSIPLKVVEVIWTWSPRPGIVLQSRLYRFPEDQPQPPVRQ